MYEYRFSLPKPRGSGGDNLSTSVATRWDRDGCLAWHKVSLSRDDRRGTPQGPQEAYKLENTENKADKQDKHCTTTRDGTL